MIRMRFGIMSMKLLSASFEPQTARGSAKEIPKVATTELK